MNGPTYCIDASALIALHPFRREIFEGLWDDIEELISDGRLVAPMQVKVELINKVDDEIERWVKTQIRMFVEEDETQGRFITDMYTKYPNLGQMALSRLNVKSADPYIVALAHTRGYQAVTQEGPREWHIPNVCHRYGIVCHNLFDMMKQEGWKYRRW